MALNRDDFNIISLKDMRKKGSEQDTETSDEENLTEQDSADVDENEEDPEDEDEESDEESSGVVTFPRILGMKTPLNAERKEIPDEAEEDPDLQEILEEVERDSARMKQDRETAQEAAQEIPAPEKRKKKKKKKADRKVSGATVRQEKERKIRRPEALIPEEDEDAYDGNIFATIREIRLPKFGDLFKNVDARKRSILTLLCVILVIGGAGWLLHTATFSSYDVVDTIDIAGSVNCDYDEFRNGILKYSQDGVAYLTQNGTEEWNYAYQISNPFVEINDKTGAIADKEGNTIIVFQKSGVVGEIETTLPIEKISVSEQGIVCAILENDESAMVMCYDRDGNVLVEHKTSPQGTGYPMDVALSDDGQNLMVTYLYTIDGAISTKVIFYNFGEAGENKTDHQTAELQYDNTITACGFYMDGDVAVAVGDNQVVFYRGTDSPKEKTAIKLDKKICSVCYDRDYLGLILEDGAVYEARMYDSSGDEVMNCSIEECYGTTRLSNGKIMMYEGKMCAIIQKNGVEKYHGTLDSTILELIPVIGINRYLMIDEDGIEKIRLVK